MKFITIIAVFIIFIEGCKPEDVSKLNGLKTVSASPADTSIHHIDIDVPPQLATISIAGDTLKMNYTENINLLISLKGYNQSWALHLKEDFSKSALKGFDYTTVDPAGNIILNWVDDNMNNITLKTVSITTIGNQPFVKINVHRTFSFKKVYANAVSAVNEQTALLNSKTGMVNFSAYVYFGKDYPLTSVSENISFKQGTN